MNVLMMMSNYVTEMRRLDDEAAQFAAAVHHLRVHASVKVYNTIEYRTIKTFASLTVVY